MSLEYRYNGAMIDLAQGIDQKPQDLVLLIATTPLELPLTVVAERDLSFGAWRCCFQIVGESHRIQLWRDERPMLQEILACVPTDTLQPRISHSFRDSCPFTVTLDRYSTTIYFREQPQPDWPNPSEMRMIEYAFPPTNGQQPVTRIQWQLSEQRLLWWTLHTYAQLNATTYVYSKSHYCLD